MTDTRHIVIWGAGGHAMVVADILRCRGGFHVAGFLDDANPHRRGQPFCDSSVLGGRGQLTELLRAGCTAAIVAVGDCAARLLLANVLVESGFSLATAIHPRAVVAASAKVGAGSVIAAGAVVNPAAVVGDHVIINTAASVDHECVLGDGVHVSPGARLGGGVVVGRGSWVAIGATVLPRVKIGENAIVGAGIGCLGGCPG